MAVAATKQRKVVMETAVNLAAEVMVVAGAVATAGVGVVVEDEAVVEEEAGEVGKTLVRPVSVYLILKH